MSKQHFLYNSDRSTNTADQRTFRVEGTPQIVSSAGLEDCVPIFVSVGGCQGCGHRDQIWTPYMVCGEPVQVCPDSTNLVLSVPGFYSFGDPEEGDMSLPGDVNVVVRPVSSQYPSLVVSETRCCGNGSDPLELCPPAVPRGLVTSWP